MLENFKRIKATIPSTCKILIVTKSRPIEDLKLLYEHGQTCFGENYVNELKEKAQALPAACFHFIGNLQTNKIKELAKIKNLQVIESLDSVDKARKLDQLLDRSIQVYVQVNTSGQESKQGCSVEDLEHLIEFIASNCNKIKLVGLMTIGAKGQDSDFLLLAELKDKFDLKFGLDLGLSMGMSDDYLRAIEFKSTQVRLGSCIFRPRPPRPVIDK